MDKILIVLVVILGVLAVAQLTRVYELTRKMSGKKEEEMSTKDNRLNGYLMLLFMFIFYAGFIWLMVRYGDQVLIHHPASIHGVWIDNLMIFNFVIILIVFFLTQTLLFYFSYKYFGREGRKALFYPHNNKLELLWTVVPAAFLAVIIIYGLSTWSRVMFDEPDENAMNVEIYGKQFDWTIRYPGEDGKLGETSYLLITTSNPLGLITQETIEGKVKEKEEKIAQKEKTLEEEGSIMPDRKKEKVEDEIEKLGRDIDRIEELKEQDIDYSKAYDDKIVTTEMHLPKDRQVNFMIRAQEVIHSAYMPHFRAQMNAVPGMETNFKFTPTITTDSMRTIKENPEFNYMLICNKICGSAHYNMKMDMYVDEQEDFQDWLNEQETYAESVGLKEEEASEMAEKR